MEGIAKVCSADTFVSAPNRERQKDSSNTSHNIKKSRRRPLYQREVWITNISGVQLQETTPRQHKLEDSPDDTEFEHDKQVLNVKSESGALAPFPQPTETSDKRGVCTPRETPEGPEQPSEASDKLKDCTSHEALGVMTAMAPRQTNNQRSAQNGDSHDQNGESVRLCRNNEFGCGEALPAAQMAAHEQDCGFTVIPCVLNECNVDLCVRDLFLHVGDAHHDRVDVLAGAGPHEISFGVNDDDFLEEFDYNTTNWSPVCIKFDWNYHFYFHMVRVRSGRWFVHVYADCSENTGFTVYIDAIDTDGSPVFNYSGAVNPFRASLKFGDEEQLEALTISNSSAKKLARRDETGFQYLEFHVKIDTSDADLKEAAMEQLPNIVTELKKTASKRSKTGTKSARKRKVKTRSQPLIRDCWLCMKEFDDLQLYKNHLIDHHFQPVLMKELPQKYPADCPKCGKKNVRDKYTMMRHYAWKDGMLFKHLDEEEQENVYSQLYRHRDEPSSPSKKSRLEDEPQTENGVGNDGQLPEDEAQTANGVANDEELPDLSPIRQNSSPIRDQAIDSQRDDLANEDFDESYEVDDDFDGFDVKDEVI